MLPQWFTNRAATTEALYTWSTMACMSNQKRDDTYCDGCMEYGHARVPPNAAAPLHQCPYHVKMHGDGFRCNCCDACTQDCIDDLAKVGATLNNDQQIHVETR